MQSPPTQLADYRWPSGSDEYIAILGMSADALAARTGLVPEEWDEDGLGRARGFFFSIPSGRVMLAVQLLALAGGPYAGVNLAVDSGELERAGASTLIAEVQDALGLEDADFTWRRDGA